MQDLPLVELIERFNARRRAALVKGYRRFTAARVTDNRSTIAPQDLVITSDSVKDGPMHEVREKMAGDWQDLAFQVEMLKTREEEHA